MVKVVRSANSQFGVFYAVAKWFMCCAVLGLMLNFLMNVEKENLLPSSSSRSTAGSSEAEDTVCPATATASVLQVEDFELSCAPFHVGPAKKPSLEDAFGYLGEADLHKAQKLANEIKQKRDDLRVTLGAGPSTTKIGENGILTDIPIVDILNATKMAALFEPNTVKTFIASHVWEHLTYPQAVTALQNIRCLLNKPNGLFRFAVPDAYNLHDKYRSEKVLEGFPNRLFKAQVPYPGHRALWTEPKLASIASVTGFDTRPLEWFTANHKFCQVENYDVKEHGRIGRSIRYAKKDMEMPYFTTSLIVDLTPQQIQTPKVRAVNGN